MENKPFIICYYYCKNRRLPSERMYVFKSLTSRQKKTKMSTPKEIMRAYMRMFGHRDLKGYCHGDFAVFRSILC